MPSPHSRFLRFTVSPLGISTTKSLYSRTLSGRFTPPTSAALFPTTLFFENSSSFFASSALRSRKDDALTPAARALFVGAMADIEDNVENTEQAPDRRRGREINKGKYRLVSVGAS